MLYPWLQGDVDCTYESIHVCRRYSTHPLGVSEYDTAYAASGTFAIHRTHTDKHPKQGWMYVLSPRTCYVIPLAPRGYRLYAQAWSHAVRTVHILFEATSMT